jgi:predicted small lipoprotein YifL
MIRRLFALIAVSLVLVACGVKTDLVTPAGKETKKGQHDPSKPPHPLGR